MGASEGSGVCATTVGGMVGGSMGADAGFLVGVPDGIEVDGFEGNMVVGTATGDGVSIGVGE